jgi:hypothetical protein
VARYAALAIGGFQLLANLAALVRGVLRLPAELTAEGATERIADLLRGSWVYGTLANLGVSVVLLCIASALARHDAVARRVATVIGGYYLVLGVVAYSYAPVKHPGFLVFSVLGIVLLVALRL